MGTTCLFGKKSRSDGVERSRGSEIIGVIGIDIILWRFYCFWILKKSDLDHYQLKVGVYGWIIIEWFPGAGGRRRERGQQRDQLRGQKQRWKGMDGTRSQRPRLPLFYRCSTIGINGIWCPTILDETIRYWKMPVEVPIGTGGYNIKPETNTHGLLKSLGFLSMPCAINSIWLEDLYVNIHVNKALHVFTSSR